MIISWSVHCSIMFSNLFTLSLPFYNQKNWDLSISIFFVLMVYYLT
jgi:hypothetical protein